MIERTDVQRVHEAAAAHARALDAALVLYAGANVGSYPSMGPPGAKLQPGLEHLEVVEVLTARAVAAAMRAEHAEIRPQSATLANLAVYAALTPVGSTLAALPPWAGGHASHYATAGVRGHRVVELPYDPERHDVDLEALPAFLERERPALVVLGGSLALFPHRLREIAAAGVPVLYDASHTAGLIAGGRFQDPLADGATAVTFSTYKSFAGPAGGAIVTRRADVAEAVSRAVYPALTANYDAARLPALHAAATELQRDGRAYADACIAAAQALSAALADAGFALVGAGRGPTESHHVAIVHDAPDAVARLAGAGIYLSATLAPSSDGPVRALRMGTQQLVRQGLTAGDMPAIAERIAAVLRG